MLNYIVKRLLQLIPIMLGVSFLTFGLMHISPSDPATMKLSAQGIAVSQEIIEKTRIDMGLDKPFIVQYLIWLKNFLLGDMGKSYVDHLPVIEKLMKAMPSTILLSASAMTVTLAISIPLGIIAAARQNKLSDYIIRCITFIGISTPNFLLSLFLIYFFALRLNWISVLPQETMTGLILPTATLSIAMASKYIRQVRAVVLEELKKDYVMGAQSRGVKGTVILYKNVLHNSMITIVTLIGLSIGSLLGGTVVVETIFQLPGLGKLAIDAIGVRDYPVVQGFVVWMALIYVMVNLITDISYWLLDPRTYSS
ncbi:binding-protein-dependent transport systems inner membrane component [Alkaliphilus metalliredigens QYMF]|uniref:Nickel import system permease protein NikB n=1 Tax=Alkaliphilus metalliredigens (strain QYMF) TaxID=293826 RepID=A6TMB0_ALKMQ|nr:nickel ABC transporter permease [Alkaliphilus metalliredigens]ABR47328.1 binding-protein-dependent transport systems inner membrane component [Alkaliphilus metalliredigens QYMF]